MSIAPLQILLVDDMPDARVSIRRLLAHPVFAGTIITEATSGGAALAICQATPPDCVLLAYHPLPRSTLRCLLLCGDRVMCR